MQIVDGFYVWKKGEKPEKLSENFSTTEMECKGKTCGCIDQKMSVKHVEALQGLRNMIGPIKINSAYRCAVHNKNVGGVKNSQHYLGYATDLSIPKDKQTKNTMSLIYSFFSGVGIYSRFVHADSRPGKDARWKGK